MSILYHMYIQLRFIYRFHVDNIDLGKSLLEHAKVQVTRELQFLEDVNCVTLRREADAESSRRLEEQQQQYFYFSKPDPILRNFWRGKELLAFWDRYALSVLFNVYFSPC